MTKWIIVAVVVGLVLFAAIRGCGDGPVPIPDPIVTDTLAVGRVDTLVVSRVDTLIFTDTVKMADPVKMICEHFSINRASYTCR